MYTTAAGNERRSKCLYNGYRRFLPTTSLWRQRSFRWNGQVYWFPNVEQREWPKERTVQSAAECVVYARPKQPICGHKGLPFRWKWRGFRWLLSCCDLMHDIKCVCVATLKTIVGYVHDGGMYDSWKQDPRHRFECAVLGTFPEVTDTDNPLPWRLTRDELSIVNERVCNMWWPHHTHRLAKNGESFFIKSKRCWKSRDKMTIFMVILPTVLSGFVPAVHQALLQLVYTLRRLEGQVVSWADATRLGVLPGSRVIDKDALPDLKEALVRGLVLLEGSLPVSTINPALHHLVHYACQTSRLGSLRYLCAIIINHLISSIIFL